MKVLITGVAGFMGSHLADDFLQKGYEVCGIDNLAGGYEENIPEGVIWWNRDLGDLDSIVEFFEGVDLVVHAACTAYEGLSVFSPALITRNTGHITATTLSASIQNHVKKFVYLSSMARYGNLDTLPFKETMTPNPVDPYGISKLFSENLIRNMCDAHGVKYTILVPHNIIGSRQKYDDPFRNVASIIVNRILQGKQPIIYGDGNQKRCFSFWKDVSAAILLACESDVSNGQVINVGPDTEFITINELASKIGKLMNFKIEPIYLPDRPLEVRLATCSAEKARTLLGYQPEVSLDEGLKELVEWITNLGQKEFKYHIPLEIVNNTTPRSWTERLI
jgi:UDP-glucose 4-epimerase